MGRICCYSWGGEGRVRTRVGLRVVHEASREETFPQLLCLFRSITEYIFDQFWRTWIDCVCETAKTDKFICAINLPPRDTGLFITVSLYYICFLMKRELNHQTQSIVRIRKDREGGIVKEERKIKMESWEENELASADTGRKGKTLDFVISKREFIYVKAAEISWRLWNRTLKLIFLKKKMI